MRSGGGSGGRSRCAAALTLAGLAVVVTAGCSTVDSRDLRTGGIDATVVVRGDGDAIEVGVGLSAGGLTSVDLQGGDALTASAAGQSVELDKAQAFQSIDYSGRLAVSPEPGTEVQVSLERDGDEDAPSSTVLLPERVEVSAPASGSTFSPRRDLRLDVDPAPGRIEVGYAGTCVDASTQATTLDVPEGAPVEVPAGTVHLTRGSAGCTVTFTVTRVRDGDLDGAYDSGSIVGEQVTHLELLVGRAAAATHATTRPRRPRPEPVATAPAPASDDGGSPLPWVVAGAVLGALLVAGLTRLRRRR